MRLVCAHSHCILIWRLLLAFRGQSRSFSIALRCGLRLRFLVVVCTGSIFYWSFSCCCVGPSVGVSWGFVGFHFWALLGFAFGVHCASRLGFVGFRCLGLFGFHFWVFIRFRCWASHGFVEGHFWFSPWASLGIMVVLHLGFIEFHAWVALGFSVLRFFGFIGLHFLASPDLVVGFHRAVLGFTFELHRLSFNVCLLCWVPFGFHSASLLGFIGRRCAPCVGFTFGLHRASSLGLSWLHRCVPFLMLIWLHLVLRLTDEGFMRVARVWQRFAPDLARLWQ